MRCRNPRTVGFTSDGKTISWSSKTFDKQYATFKLPCGKCLQCRLEYARQVAVRCVHEAKMYDNNSFVTLTYDEKNLSSDKLYYVDFQKFEKALRTSLFDNLLKKIFPNNSRDCARLKWRQLEKSQKDFYLDTIRLPILVTGEYGELRKRPHWHSLIFNWRPTDTIYKYTSDLGHKVYTSETLDVLWGKGLAELGSVTFESAGYCARYAAKKLVHGNDQEHDYQPIHRRSKKYAIGKRFIEKYWSDVFNHGYIILDGGIKTSIPRYYEKWLQKNQPQAWLRYIRDVKLPRMSLSDKKQNIEIEEWWSEHDTRRDAHGWQVPPPITRQEIENQILEKNFERLQMHLKGDI